MNGNQPVWKELIGVVLGIGTFTLGALTLVINAIIRVKRAEYDIESLKGKMADLAEGREANREAIQGLQVHIAELKTIAKDTNDTVRWIHDRCTTTISCGLRPGKARE